MAIAHQTEVVGAANTATPYDIPITPPAAIKACCVVIHQNTSAADSVTSVTYGTGADGVPLSRAPSPYGFVSESSEPGAVYIYWAGDSNIWPAGAQTVRIVRTGTFRMQAVVSTMTVAAGQVVTLDAGGALGTATATANPSWTHASGVNNVMAYLGIHSGLQTMTTTPATGWTLQSATDIGNQGCGFARLTSATNTAGSLGAGWTASTAEDFAGASISFKEAPPPSAPPSLRRPVVLSVAVQRASIW
jgi:hypothetical protein